MPQQGMSGVGVGMAAAGGFLLYIGIAGSGIREGLKSLSRGSLPEKRKGGGEYTSKGEAALNKQGVPADGAGPDVGSGPHPELAAAALKYKGVPYVWGGTTPKGLDCSGLVVLAFRDAYGVIPPRVTTLQVAWKPLHKIKRSEVGAGDILFWPPGGAPSHVGIAVDNTRVVHAPRPGSHVKVVPINQAFPGGIQPSCYRYTGRG